MSLVLLGWAMTSNHRIDRARRNALKAAGLAVSAVLATGIPNKRAAAQWGGGGHHWGGGCFARGTSILTRHGYRPIESLSTGDEIAVHFSGFAPIKAIDSFSLSRAAGQWDGEHRPVRLRRGALADNIPAEDICLTASHAVFIDGALVPVGNLVNGTSIVWEAAEGGDALDFFHIELARHDVLYAQGAPCESLRQPAEEPCVPLIGFNGSRSEFSSRLRSAASVVIDRRRHIDIIRDTLEERGLQLAHAA